MKLKLYVACVVIVIISSFFVLPFLETGEKYTASGFSSSLLLSSPPGGPTIVPAGYLPFLGRQYVAPTPTPTPTPSPTPTRMPVLTLPIITSPQLPVPATPTPGIWLSTATPTATATATPTASPTPTLAASATPTPTPSNAPTCTTYVPENLSAGESVYAQVYLRQGERLTASLIVAPSRNEVRVDIKDPLGNTLKTAWLQSGDQVSYGPAEIEGWHKVYQANSWLSFSNDDTIRVTLTICVPAGQMKPMSVNDAGTKLTRGQEEP